MSGYQTHFNLIHSSGWNKEFLSLYDVISFCEKEGLKVYSQHKKHEYFYCKYSMDKTLNYPWIVRDFWGKIVDIYHDYTFWPQFYNRRKNPLQILKLTAEVNRLPIPYTGKNCYRYSVRCRSPAHKAYQVMKNTAYKTKNDEDHIGIRVKGRLRRMLTRIDEPHRGRQGFSWKRHRRTQWK